VLRRGKTKIEKWLTCIPPIWRAIFGVLIGGGAIYCGGAFLIPDSFVRDLLGVPGPTAKAASAVLIAFGFLLAQRAAEPSAEEAKQLIVEAVHEAMVISSDVKQYDSREHDNEVQEVEKSSST